VGGHAGAFIYERGSLLLLRVAREENKIETPKEKKEV
jgi:hypothetical protein